MAVSNQNWLCEERRCKLWNAFTDASGQGRLERLIEPSKLNNQTGIAAVAGAFELRLGLSRAGTSQWSHDVKGARPHVTEPWRSLWSRVQAQKVPDAYKLDSQVPNASFPWRVGQRN